MSNLAIAGAQEYHSKTKEVIDRDLLRHIILNSVRALKTKLSAYSDEIILAYDGRSYWRKDEFEFYKGKRKAGREASTFDWTRFFEDYNVLKQEFRENLPFVSLEIDGAEADDVIGVLAKLFGNSKKICIASSDTDFVQLQQLVNSSIKQWSMNKKKFITPQTESYDLLEHIVRGDVGDGIPNILSDGDTLMNPDKRQTPLKKTALAEWQKHGIANYEKFCKDAAMLDRFTMNKKLIDFRCIPEHIAIKIADAYHNYDVVKGKTFNYLTKNRLVKILREGGL